VKNKIYNILKGTFLVSDDSFKNWRVILFFSALALIMIASSHSADSKVHHIANLNQRNKALRSSYVQTRAQLMEFKMESVIRQRLAAKQIGPAQNPPIKLIVKSEIKE
jgi:hypothetical protein